MGHEVFVRDEWRSEFRKWELETCADGMIRMGGGNELNHTWNKGTIRLRRIAIELNTSTEVQEK
jgi:hypothetical protein